MNSNLILIDGISGSGKSTTAQRLYLYLIKNGHEAEWFYEHEIPHPIYRADEVKRAMEAGSSESDRMHEIAISNWTRLVDSLSRSNRITILESTLFQTAVGSQFLVGWEPSAIEDYVMRVHDIIQKADPVFIYFYRQDIARALQITNEKRGGDFYAYLVDKMANTPYGRRNPIQNIQDVIETFRRFREITDRLFSRFRLRKLAIDTTEGDWEESMRRISHFLSIGKIENPSVPLNDWQDFTGRYRNSEYNHDWVIAGDGTGLYFDDLFRARLLHKIDNVFYLEGSCLELSFEKNEKGRIHSVICRGNLPGETVIGTVWMKVI